MAVEREIATIFPSFVVIAAGLTGRPNVDWCEDHKAEVLGINFAATLKLIQLCSRLQIHWTYFGTGCIYQYDSIHENSLTGLAFTEDDIPNFSGSYYSLTKCMLERDLAPYLNDGLVLRIRMPIDSNFEDNPRNLIFKLIQYSHSIADNLWNSITVFDDTALNLIGNMIQRRTVGIFNFCNPRPVLNSELCTLYQTYRNCFQQFAFVPNGAALLQNTCKAPRSNCILASDKLAAWCTRNHSPMLPDSLVAVRQLLCQSSPYFIDF